MCARTARSITFALVGAALVFSCNHAGTAEPPITALEFSADGDVVIAGSQAGITVYSWPELQPTLSKVIDVDNIHDLAMSPDGRHLAVAGGSPTEEGIIQLFAWPDLTTVRKFVGHDDCVTSVVWQSPAVLASSGLDRAIIVWDVQTAQTQRLLMGHSRGVTGLCFVDLQHLVSVGLDQNLRVWNWQSGEQVRSLNNHMQPILALSLCPKQKSVPLVASVSEDRSVRFWQPTIGRMVRFARLESIPLDCCWTHAGSALAVACQDGRVRIVDPETAEITQTINVFNDWAFSIAAHPDDGSHCVGGRDGSVRRIILPHSISH